MKLDLLTSLTILVQVAQTLSDFNNINAFKEDWITELQKQYSEKRNKEQ